MAVQAALQLGHRARVRRVHAVPRHPRLHGALDRAHAPLARALPALARRSTARATRRSTGSSRAASSTTCGSSRPATVAASGCDGIAIGGSLGQDKAQMYEVVSWTTRELERLAPERPRHLLGIGDIDDLIAGVELGIDTFDCAMPTRLGRHGVALVPDPDAAGASISPRRAGASPRADPRRLPMPGVRRRLLPRLPALPAARRRADRRCG